MKLDDTIDLWRKVYQRGYARDRHDEHTRAELTRRLSLIERPARLLDLGCGHCEWLNTYLEHGAEINLVDSADLTAHFAAADGARFRQADVLELEGQLEPVYDLVVASKLIHNIPLQDHARMMRLMASVCAPGGCAMVSVASVRDPARLSRDRPLSRNGTREYLTGVAHGRSAYRCYFGADDADNLVIADFELLSKEEFSAPSGIPGHEARRYWQLVLNRREAGAPPASRETDEE